MNYRLSAWPDLEVLYFAIKQEKEKVTVNGRPVPTQFNKQSFGEFILETLEEYKGDDRVIEAYQKQAREMMK